LVWLVDVLMSRYLPRERALMKAADREELGAFLPVLRRARKAYERGEAEEMSDSCCADMTWAELPEESNHDLEVGTTRMAQMTGVSHRHAARLAAQWESEGLARRVSGSWLIAVTAVEAYRDNPDRRTA
jgi:hypothetical protein